MIQKLKHNYTEHWPCTCSTHLPFPSNDELLELVSGENNLVHVGLGLGQPGMVEALLCCQSLPGNQREERGSKVVRTWYVLLSYQGPVQNRAALDARLLLFVYIWFSCQVLIAY